VTARKGVAELSKGLCSKEGKFGGWTFFVNRIAIWNQMHIGSVPWNNESVTVH